RARWPELFGSRFGCHPHRVHRKARSHQGGLAIFSPWCTLWLYVLLTLLGVGVVATRRLALRRFLFEAFQLFLLLLRLGPITVGTLLIVVRFEGHVSLLVALKDYLCLEGRTFGRD